MINVYEAIFTAIAEEQRDVGLQPFTGRIDKHHVTNGVRMDGTLEDCQRVIAMAAALLSDSAHHKTVTDGVPWEEVQLELLNDMQDLIINLPMPDPRDQIGIHDIDRIFIVFPFIPYMHRS